MQAPFCNHQQQNNYDYEWLKRWRLDNDEQFNATFWMRGDNNRIAMLAAPWDPDSKNTVLLIVRLTAVAERYTNISVLSEAWKLPDGQQQAKGVPIRDHETREEVILADYYYAHEGQLYQLSQGGLLIRNDSGRVIRIEEIKYDGKDRAAQVCAEGSGRIPDGLRGALIYDWSDEVRQQVKAKLEEMHEACGESITVH